MESDRPSISRSGERPVTRWRREQEPNEKSLIFNTLNNGPPKPYGKMERPTSRRGTKTDVTEYGMSRPSTSGRNVLSRPPSASIMTNRIPTPASRINTMSSMTLSRANSALMRNYIQPNAKVHDRPITQQGLVGIPASSSKGLPKLAKQIQDKRIYEQVLQQKIRELNQEIETITQQVEKQNNGSAYLEDDENINDSVIELNKIEGQLMDYNMIFDKIVSGVNKKEIIREAKELKEFNDREEVEMKDILQKREQIQKRKNELNREIESRKIKSELVLGNKDSEAASKIEELYKEKNELQKELNILQKKQNQLSHDKAKIQEKISVSPIKQEAYKIYIKIVELEKIRDKFMEDENINFPSEKEEAMFKNYNLENLDINTAERQIVEIEKKIADARQELHQLETENDEVQSEKLKNNESNKPEEIMDIFMSSIEKTKTEELEKLTYLEKEIVSHLEQISNNISEILNSNVLMDDEMEMINGLMNQHVENKNEKSFEELKQENIKLRKILNKLKSLESKIKTEIDDSKNNTEAMYKGETNYLNASNIIKEEENELNAQNDLLIKQEKKNNELKKEDEYNMKLKRKIEFDEIYRSISILQDKIERISLGNEQIEETVEEQNELGKSDSAKLLEKLISLTGRYNTFLINEMKSLY